MSLTRVILFAVGLAALAVAAPTVAPNLLRLALAPAGTDIPAPRDATPPAAVAPVAAARDEPATFRRPRGRTVVLDADRLGHFEVDAVVNGRSITAMVDTGATSVALNAASARRLGIYLSPRDYRLPVSTANGVIAAAPVTLSEVRLGAISVRNVQAVVLPGEVLQVNLLGMTFLSRLSRFEVARGQLLLVQ